MNKEQEYFIKLLSNHVNQVKSEKVEDIDLKLLYKISKEQAASAIVYQELSKCYSEEEMGELYIKFYGDLWRSIKISLEQEQVSAEISIALSQGGVKHIFLKGVQIKKLYPASELRIMGDIDIFVHTEDVSIAHQSIENKKFNSFATNFAVTLYRRNDITIELHNIISEIYDIKKSSLCSNSLDCLWDMIEPVDKNFNLLTSDKEKIGQFAYFLMPEALFLLVIAHIVKHMRSSGCGIRMFLDLAVISKHYQNEMKWDEIETSIHKMRYDKTCKYIFYMLDKWFDVKIPIMQTDNSNEDIIVAFEEFVLGHGIFGKIDRNKFTRKVKSGFLKNIFISRRILKEKYPVLKKYEFLVPFFWCYRLLSFLLGKTKTKFEIKEIMKSIEPAKEYAKFLENIGVKQ